MNDHPIRRFHPSRRAFFGRSAGFLTATLAAPLGGIAGPALAQDKPTTWKAVTNHRNGAAYSHRWPWFHEQIKAKTGGRLAIELTTVPELGLTGQELLRSMKSNLLDFADIVAGYVSGDFPAIEAPQLPGLYRDGAHARQGFEAWTAKAVAPREDIMGGKVLAYFNYNPVFLFSKFELTKPEDLKGKKVRVFNNTMRDFLGGIGATAVSMAFAEVVPALNNGVVDCGVTGSLSGNTAGWPEVTKSLYPMSLGWSINILAVNLNTWKRLDPKVQAFIEAQVKTYEDKMWTTLKKADSEADNCNTNKQPCTMGKLANITIVPVKPAEMEAHKKLVEGAVLAGWAKRCGSECAKEWNETVGKVLGLKAPTS